MIALSRILESKFAIASGNMHFLAVTKKKIRQGAGAGCHTFFHFSLKINISLKKKGLLKNHSL